MKIDMQEIEPCVKKLTVEIPVEKVNEERETALRSLSKDVNVPGFRKGHVPRKMIEKLYGKAVAGDVAQELIDKAFKEAVSSNDLHLAGKPMIDEIKADDGGPISFVAIVEIFPEITLKEVDGLSFTRKIKNVADADVDKVLERYRDRQKRLEPVEGRGVEGGDMVIADYSATKEDGTPITMIHGERKSISVEKARMLEGLYDGMIGMNKDDERDINVTLPKEFPDPEMAGALARFKVKVHEIKRNVLPELDDQLAKEVSEFDTLEELRSDIRKNLEKEEKSQADGLLRDDLFTKLIEENPFPLPPKYLEGYADDLIKRRQEELSRHGIDAAQLYGETGMRETALKDAERQSKEWIILSAYGKANKIELTENDTMEAVERVASSMGRSLEETHKMFSQAEGAYTRLFNEVFYEKVYKSMLEKLTITDEYADKTEGSDDK